MNGNTKHKRTLQQKFRIMYRAFYGSQCENEKQFVILCERTFQRS